VNKLLCEVCAKAEHKSVKVQLKRLQHAIWLLFHCQNW